jgi:hypothetical protein
MGSYKVRVNKVGLSAFICLLTIFSNSLGTNLPIFSNTSRVLAQTSDARKAEADRLLQQGIEQYKTSQNCIPPERRRNMYNQNHTEAQIQCIYYNFDYSSTKQLNWR